METFTGACLRLYPVKFLAGLTIKDMGLGNTFKLAEVNSNPRKVIAGFLLLGPPV
jgi:hypothetical protein